jgi:hypothetical protein
MALMILVALVSAGFIIRAVVRRGKVAGIKSGDCLYENKVVGNGKTVKTPDGCGECQCQEGEILCTLRACQ